MMMMMMMITPRKMSTKPNELTVSFTYYMRADARVVALGVVWCATQNQDDLALLILPFYCASL